jgi:hypothetical protein
MDYSQKFNWILFKIFIVISLKGTSLIERVFGLVLLEKIVNYPNRKKIRFQSTIKVLNAASVNSIFALIAILSI